MNTKITITLAILVIIAGGALYFSTQGNTPNTNTNAAANTELTQAPQVTDLGAQRLAQGYLALVLDSETSAWATLPDEGIKKNHGVGHPESPCPDFFAPMILQFPDDVFTGATPPPSNLTIGAPDSPWLGAPVQVAIPSNGSPVLPSSVPQLPNGYFSDPFFVNFNCGIPNFETQTLNGNVMVTIYNDDNTLFKPAFEIPVNLDVYTQNEYPTDERFFNDGYEDLPTSCSNFGTPDEDCWNLIVFP